MTKTEAAKLATIIRKLESFQRTTKGIGLARDIEFAKTRLMDILNRA